jgi:LmbE family N-acetylglucosaminyl deacetylase
VTQLVAQRKPVTCVLCTSGNRGTDNAEITMDEIAATREREQLAAANLLGVKDVRFLRYDDGDLAFIVRELREQIVGAIREVKPRTVITHDPYPGDGGQDSCSIYPDHLAVGRATFESAFVYAPGPLLGQASHDSECQKIPGEAAVRGTEGELARNADRDEDVPGLWGTEQRTEAIEPMAAAVASRRCSRAV